MSVALHGELTLHPWRDPATDSSDAFSLFVARSSAMGWLAEGDQDTGRALWGMNDAGYDLSTGPAPSRVAWFQVALTEPIPAGRPLPVQQFLSCAADVVARIGTFHLSAVGVLLPVQALIAPAEATSRLDPVATLIQDTGWFADSDSESTLQVRVTIDGGRESSIVAAAPELLQWMKRIKQDVFACDSFSSDTDGDTLTALPNLGDEWQASAPHRVTFRGSLAEWSLEALGWLGAFFADVCARHEVTTPLIFTARRSGEQKE